MINYIRKQLKKISTWISRKMTPPGFLEVYDELEKVNRENPNDWGKISHLYHRLVNGHGVCATYGDPELRDFHFKCMKMYDDLRQDYRQKYQEYFCNIAR